MGGDVKSVRGNDEQKRENVMGSNQLCVGPGSCLKPPVLLKDQRLVRRLGSLCLCVCETSSLVLPLLFPAACDHSLTPAATLRVPIWD